MTDSRRKKDHPGDRRRPVLEAGKAALAFAFVAAVVWLAFSLGAWLQERNDPAAYWASLGAQTIFTVIGTGLDPDTVGRPTEADSLRLKVRTAPPAGPLLAVTEGTEALLLNRRGRIVQRWKSDHQTAFPGSHLPDAAVTWREPVLMPDGDIIAISRRRSLLRPGDLLGGHHGLGVVRVGPQGDVRWTTRLRAHHVPVRGPDGGILVLWRRPAGAPDARYPDLHRPFFDEGLARLDPATGRVTRRASFLDLLAGSGFANLLHHPPMMRDGYHLKGEVFHANTVRPVSPRAGRNAPFADPGDLVVSFRNLSTAAVLDADTWQVTTLLRGPWKAQHDVGVRPAGTVAAFDNIAPDGASRVVVWNPGTGRIVRTFGGAVLNSPTRGARQAMPDGGTLATDARGRAVRFGPDGAERWRLVLQADGVFLNSVRRVPRRHAARFLAAPGGR